MPIIIALVAAALVGLASGCAATAEGGTLAVSSQLEDGGALEGAPSSEPDGDAPAAEPARADGTAPEGAPSALDALRARLPEELRGRATVAIIGTHSRRAGPCVLVGRTRRRYLDAGFDVTEVLLGEVRARRARINTAQLPEGDHVEHDLEQGRAYGVLLRPSDASMAILADEEGRFGPHDALRGEEIVAILPL